MAFKGLGCGSIRVWWPDLQEYFISNNPYLQSLGFFANQLRQLRPQLGVECPAKGRLRVAGLDPGVQHEIDLLGGVQGFVDVGVGVSRGNHRFLLSLVMIAKGARFASRSFEAGALTNLYV